MSEWLRGPGYSVEVEVAELLEIVTKEATKGAAKGSAKGAGLATSRFLRPLGLTCTLFVFHALCGCDLLSYYNGVIFR